MALRSLIQNMLPFLRLGFVLIALAQDLVAQEDGPHLTGKVFDDRNQNLVHDQHEPGVPDCLVSNGSAVVKTDENGRYEITQNLGHDLFVIKPQGWQVPLTEHNLPLFSAGMLRPHQAALGRGAESVNFPLHRAEEPDSFRVAVLGDPQVADATQLHWFQQEVFSVPGIYQEIAFGLGLGDLVDDRLDLLPELNVILAETGFPWWQTIGNHDLDLEVEDNSAAKEKFRSLYGPTTYAFQHNKVWFVILDNILLNAESEDAPSYIGGYLPDQISFLQQLLVHVPRDHLIVLAQHIPLFQIEEWGGNTIQEKSRDKLLSLFTDHPKVLSLSAHTHRMSQYHLTIQDGWKHTSTHRHINVGASGGSWWRGRPAGNGVPESPMRDGVPKGFLTIDFQETDYTLNWWVYGEQKARSLALYLPANVTTHDPWSGVFFLNFFLSDPDSKVEFRIGGNAWSPMRRKPGLDPLYTSQWMERHLSAEAGYRPLPPPALCEHLWEGFIPTDLEPGSYSLTVRATNGLGQDFVVSDTISVVPPSP